MGGGLLPLRFSRTASRINKAFEIIECRYVCGEDDAGEDAASATVEALGAAVPCGNMGQWEGAVNLGVLPGTEACN
ncbi:MAG: hypothetical protein KGL64_06575 [Acidobacteriota bacterium]|nr:hypothetical protein [Acidobacteriota bacterium]